MPRVALKTGVTVGNPTQFTGGRHVDTDSHGHAWITSWNGLSGTTTATFDFWRREGNDAPVHVPAMGFAFQAGGATYAGAIAMQIDEDDFMHVVYKDRGNGTVWYRRGTPNADRTSYTWSAPLALTTSTVALHFDLVAFRNPEAAGGWHVHVVWARTATDVQIRSVYVSPAGVFTLGTVGTVATTNNNFTGIPSIDFHHAGDGKAVGGSAPHLYVSWVMGASGASYGWRYRRYAYTAPGGVPTWTAGTVRIISQTYYATDAQIDWLNVLYLAETDTVYIAGALFTGSARHLVFASRDEADTTGGVQWARTAAGDNVPINGQLQSIGNGALRLVGRAGSNAVGTLAAEEVCYREWYPETGLGDVVELGYEGRSVQTSRFATRSPTLLSGGGTAPNVTIDLTYPEGVPGVWRWDGAAWEATQWFEADVLGVFRAKAVYWWDGATWQPGPIPTGPAAAWEGPV